MKVRTDLPRKVREIENVFIPMPDGCRLAARIWLPEDAEGDPVPAILEYVPYRKRDHTALRDVWTHPYVAGHGYANVRVDIRGSGDSDGVLEDEYLALEQDDGVAVIEWLARQPWCSGAVGMIGISWGGFNGLQVAARQPEALKGIITVCSTDDRYADDIHYMGGCMLTDNLSWSSEMFRRLPCPPDPAIVGERWRDMWLERLRGLRPWILEWLKHQRRDAFWEHGSVCEDLSQIRCPVYAVGGWADGYSNAIFRLLAGLGVPCKGLIGPWAHVYPHDGHPGPAIGFLQEQIRWWDHCLKGIDTGIMDEPPVRAWIQDSMPPRPYYEERPGRWVAEPGWPSDAIGGALWRLTEHGLVADGEPASESAMTLCSPQDAGLTGGIWCPHGKTAELALDQRMEEGNSLVFDTPPLEEAVEILGAPVVELDVVADRPDAFVAVCLSDVLPDGRATRVTFGLLNLTHRDGHADPQPLEPGKRYRVRVQLNEVGQKFPVGHRIRVAVSTAYWPMVWPSPEAVTLTLHGSTSTLSLPVREPRDGDAALAPFPEVEGAPPLRRTILEPGETRWDINRHVDSGEVEVVRTLDSGRVRLDDIALEIWNRGTERFTIRPNDPLSARLETDWTVGHQRGEWHTENRTRCVLTATKDAFRVTATLDSWEGEDRVRVYSEDWDETIPRDHV